MKKNQGISTHSWCCEMHSVMYLGRLSVTICYFPYFLEDSHCFSFSFPFIKLDLYCINIYIYYVSEMGIISSFMRMMNMAHVYILLVALRRSHFPLSDIKQKPNPSWPSALLIQKRPNDLQYGCVFS